MVQEQPLNHQLPHQQPPDGTAPPTPPTPPQLIGDFDNNECVDFKDFLLFSYAFGKFGDYYKLFDLNGDGIINQADHLIFSSNFGNGCIAKMQKILEGKSGETKMPSMKLVSSQCESIKSGQPCVQSGICMWSLDGSNCVDLGTISYDDEEKKFYMPITNNEVYFPSTNVLSNQYCPASDLTLLMGESTFPDGETFEESNIFYRNGKSVGFCKFEGGKYIAKEYTCKYDNIIAKTLWVETKSQVCKEGYQKCEVKMTDGDISESVPIAKCI